MIRTLRHYQEEGANFLVERKRAFLADEMGLGKTIQAIEFINRIIDETEGSFLIVCPASLRLNWLQELQRWLKYPGITVKVLGALPQAVTFTPNLFADVVVISYNQLAAWHRELRCMEWEAIIADEAHYLQSLDSQRTIELRGGWGKSPIPTKRKIALTGTPLQNRPINLYPILKWLECPFAQKEYFFGERFCGGEKMNNRGATNIEELNEKLKTVMLRRTKAEVLGELPPKTRQIIPLDLGDDGEVALAEERKILDGAGIADLDSPSIFDLDKGVIARLRRNTGMAKVKAAAQFIVDALENVDKVLVFAHHRDVIGELFGLLSAKGGNDWQVVSLLGGMSDADKNQALKFFQEGESWRVFLGQIEAAGVGLTLTAASLVIFVEQDWTPGKNVQAEDRAHRLGQKENVLIQYLVLNNSLDAHIARRNIEKQEVLDAVLA